MLFIISLPFVVKNGQSFRNAMQLIKTYPAQLAPYIKYFYSLMGNGREMERGIHRVLPDGTLELIINLGDALRLSQDGIHWQQTSNATLLGLYPEKSFMQYTGAVHLVGAVFQPGYAGLFLNDALEQFAGHLLPADFVYGITIETLRDQLSAIATEPQKHALLEKFLLNRINTADDAFRHNHILSAVQLIHSHKGNIKMPALATSAYLSERHFRRKFTELVGMNPKQYANIIRIKSIVKLHSISHHSFADIIEETGYTDRAHFVKDFRNIAGITPSQFFAQLNAIDQEFLHAPSAL